MAETIEAKHWTTLTVAFIVDVKSLADLQRIADAFKIPFIVKKGKEYVVFCGHLGAPPMCYRFKE